jgi:hypothetical protein
MHPKRPTITLEADTDALARRLMRERGLSFNHAVNEAIRSGSPGARQRRGFRTPTFGMGLSAVPVGSVHKLMDRR